MGEEIDGWINDADKTNIKNCPVYYVRMTIYTSMFIDMVSPYRMQ